MIAFNGKTLCISELAELYGISAKLVYARLKHGWSVERILTTPPRQCGKRP